MAWITVNTLDLSGAPEAVAALESVGKIISLSPDRIKVLEAMGSADAYFAGGVILVDQEFLDAAPNLKIIGAPSTGTDHMNRSAIHARGIECFDIAKEYGLINGFSATSELVFALLLALNRKLLPALEAAKKGDWARERYTGFQLNGKTLGILGLGRLGTISARIGIGFGMKVIAHEPAETTAEGVEMVGFDALMERADVLSIHVHLSDQTRGLIGRDAFERMKRGAILINTSRGAIVDEAALLQALESGKLAGAGLDVIDGEWLDQDALRGHPLIAYARDHDNLLISPHIGGATTESIYGARVFMARKMADYIRRQAARG